MREEWIYVALAAVAAVNILFTASARLRKILLLVSVGLLGFAGLELPSVHCIVEGLVSRASLEFLKPGMAVKLGVAFLTAPLLGRLFCGYVCPKGAAQELVLVPRWAVRVPRGVDRWLRRLPYLSLAALVAAPVAFHYRLWADLDPFLWVFQWHGHVAGLVLLALVLPTSLLVLRPFCRYLCPLVPLFRLVSLRPIFRRRVSDACTGCSAGARSCRWGAITLAESAGKQRCHIDFTECLQCLSCRGACPKEALR